jgi:hypothetical protein
MLILPESVYKTETHIVPVFHDWQTLPYCRLGVTTSDDGKIGTTSAGPYKLVLAYAAVRAGGPFVNRVHRVCYLNVGGWPLHVDGVDEDTVSDNLLVPSSFIAGEPLTIEPLNFGQSDCGLTVNLKNKWCPIISDRKAAWDKHCRSFGVVPLETSVERWGQTYEESDC